MSNDIIITNLPEDPAESERSSNPKSFEEVLEGVERVGLAADKYIVSPEVAVATVPTIGIDAQGVPTVTVPLTKKTKAIVSAVGTTVTSGATAALALFGPDTTESHVLTLVVAVVGIIATTFGTHQATNLPDLKKAAKHVS